MALEIAYRSAIFATKATRSSHAVTDTGDLQNMSKVPRRLGISPSPNFQSSLWYHFDETGFSYLVHFLRTYAWIPQLLPQLEELATVMGPSQPNPPKLSSHFSLARHCHCCRCLVHSPQEVVDQLLSLDQPMQPDPAARGWGNYGEIRCETGHQWVTVAPKVVAWDSSWR
jgi:hypothetical protein